MTDLIQCEARESTVHCLPVTQNRSISLNCIINLTPDYGTKECIGMINEILYIYTTKDDAKYITSIYWLLQVVAI
jgi:hypothetical protein